MFQSVGQWGIGGTAASRFLRPIIYTFRYFYLFNVDIRYLTHYRLRFAKTPKQHGRRTNLAGGIGEENTIGRALAQCQVINAMSSHL